MLYEDDVVDAVAAFVVAHGWTLNQALRATQRGDDIVATRGDLRLVVEAKGEGSSTPGSKRYGQRFTTGQADSHVGRAVIRQLRLVGRSGEKMLAAVAFPDNADHHSAVDDALPGLRAACIGVLWVSGGGEVVVDAPWALDQADRG